MNLSAKVLSLAFSILILPAGVVAAPAKTSRDCARCPEMALIPAGSVVMGSPASERDRMDNEGPQHTVTFAHSFELSIYDVTRAEYAQFVEATDHSSPGCDVWNHKDRWVNDPSKDWRDPGFQQTDRDPVVCISWNDAIAYISWLNALPRLSKTNSMPFRLPSEAEWEYAARAGTTTANYWGESTDHANANYGVDSGKPFGPLIQGADKWEFTSPVGSFPANAFGLYDMVGNVTQDVQDCFPRYGDGYEGAPIDGSAWNKSECVIHGGRGTAWDASSRFVRISNRTGGEPSQKSDTTGFRIAKSLE